MSVIPFWLKIVGPLVLLAILFGAWKLDRRAQYNKGHDAGVTETDAIYKAASDKLKEDAAKSATRADDLAAERLADHVVDATAEAAEAKKAEAEGRSPLDVLFGGQ